jgi:[lysine-biosynthesis-protein LysW]---L-2-aminoadipate ligase
MTGTRTTGTIHIVSSGVLAEEKAILATARKLGVTATAILDSDLLIGASDQIPDDGSVVIVRTSSYFRGCAITSWLEGRKHPLLNSFEALALFGVKSRTDGWLHKNGLPAIPSLVCLGNSSIEAAWKHLGFPMVVKPDIGGFGKRVHLARDELELRQISESIFELAPSYQRYVYAQKYCDIKHDLRVFILDGKVLAVIERVNDKTISISKNVAQGGSGICHALDKTEEELVEKVAQALPPGYFGVDILVTRNGECFVCEINAACKFSETAKVTGVDIASKIVEAAIERMRTSEHA